MSRDASARSAVTLCVVNFEGERYLPACLESAFAVAEPFGEVLLVDSASRDGSAAWVEAHFPAVKVVRLPENRGPGVARNQGYRMASHPRVLFLDVDARLDPACPGGLAAALDADPQAVLAVPRTLYAREPGTVQYEGADAHFLGLMILRRAGEPDARGPATPTRIDSLVTTCFLVDRRRWPRAELFDESFVFNYEDHDLGLRTRVLGGAILAVPEARVWHGEGTAGLSYRTGGRRAELRTFCLIRNRWQILLKVYARRTLLVFLPALVVYEAFQLAGCLARGWLGPWLHAAGWMLRHFRLVLHKRRLVQDNRKTRDREILRGGPMPFTRNLAQSGVERRAVRALDAFAARYWRLARRWI